MEKVAFIGLGVMGYPMAGHLARAGYKTTVYNRTGVKADTWGTEFGGTVAATPREAATGAEVVFACVGNDDDIRSVVYGDDGILSGMQEGAVLVDHTTASPALARELESALEGAGCGFLDAPVSGGQAGAENGQLTIMVGGRQAPFDTSSRIMEVYAKSVRLMGPSGSGQLTKAVNQICIAGILPLGTPDRIFLID